MKQEGDIDKLIEIGDLVEYRPPFSWDSDKIARGIVIAESFATIKKHHRIRVMWLGDLPIQSNALATSENKRVTTWVNPKHFIAISKTV